MCYLQKLKNQNNFHRPHNTSTMTTLRFTPTTKEELINAIRTRNLDDMNEWDVSHITDMSDLFKDMETFNHDINNWDVSNVTNMSHMFYRAKSFNQPLERWNVSNVTDMSCMFFSLPILINR